MKISPHNSIGFWIKRILLAFQKNADAELTDLEITMAESIPLIILEFFGPRPMSEISRQVSQSHPAILRHIDKLESKGYLERVPDADDRRKKILTLTKKGKSMAPLVIEKLWIINRKALTGFDPEEEKLFLSLLKRVFINLTEGKEMVIPFVDKRDEGGHE